METIWLKSGADKRRIHSKEEFRRLFQEVDLVHADEVPTRAGIEAINPKFVLDFLTDIYHEALPDLNSERLKFLENMNPARNRLNLAGLLLFAENLNCTSQNSLLRLFHFPGTKIVIGI